MALSTRPSRWKLWPAIVERLGGADRVPGGRGGVGVGEQSGAQRRGRVGPDEQRARAGVRRLREGGRGEDEQQRDGQDAEPHAGSSGEVRSRWWPARGAWPGRHRAEEDCNRAAGPETGGPGPPLPRAGPRGTMPAMVRDAAIVHSPGYHCDIGVHVFPMEKFGLLRRRLVTEGHVADAAILEPAPASREDLARVHGAEYLDDLEGLRWTRRTKSSELPLTAEIVQRVPAGGGGHDAGGARGAGARLRRQPRRRLPPRARRPRRGLLLPERHRRGDPGAAARGGRAARRGRGLRRAPGQRHRAACSAATTPSSRFSIHQEYNYPSPKEPGDLDVGLEDGTGDDEYLARARARARARLGGGARAGRLPGGGRRLPRGPAGRAGPDAWRASRPATGWCWRAARGAACRRWSRWAAATRAGSRTRSPSTSRPAGWRSSSPAAAAPGRRAMIRCWHAEGAQVRPVPVGGGRAPGALRSRAPSGWTWTPSPARRWARRWRRSASTRWRSRTWWWT